MIKKVSGANRVNQQGMALLHTSAHGRRDISLVRSAVVSSVGLINSVGFVELDFGPSPNDTLALHPGWTELVNYAGSRPTFSYTNAPTENEKARGVELIMTTDDRPVFTFTSAGSIKGVLVVLTATNPLMLGQPEIFSMTELDSPLIVGSNDTLTFEYKLTIESTPSFFPTGGVLEG